ncbi:aminotransferase class I/II-fold pyridoxal phosphate-dependent enzyme, partial [Pseudomonas atacamensis]
AGHMKNVQQKLVTQQTLTQRCLLKQGWQFEIAPEGGMFIWARHPEISDTQDFVSKLEKQKILLMPGSSFSVTRDYRDFIRLNCSHFSATLE